MTPARAQGKRSARHERDMAPTCHRGARRPWTRAAPTQQTRAVLTGLGLDAAHDALYRAVLRAPDADVAALAGSEGLEPGEVAVALDELGAAGLLRPQPTTPCGWVPVRPDVALEGLLAQEQAAIARRQEEVVRTRAQITDLLETYLAGTARESLLEVELVEGLPAIRARLHQLVLGATTTVHSLISHPEDSPEAVTSSVSSDIPLAARGVVLRYVFPYTVRETVHVWPELLRAEERGVQIRLAKETPLRTVVVDGRAAVLPLDPDDPGRGALFVHSPSLVACADTLFSASWAAGEPLLQEGAVPDVDLSERDRQLLVLLGTGAPDETVARQLGVAVRTVRRDLARLLEELGASSRFQAGVLAARRGWL